MLDFKHRQLVRKRLVRMQGTKKTQPDGRGIFLGDGLPYESGEEIRSQDLIDMIDCINMSNMISSTKLYTTQMYGLDGVNVLAREYRFENFLEYFQKNNKSNNLPYHNEYHSYSMVLNCFEGTMSFDEFDYSSSRALLVAALFHDFNHSGGVLTDDKNIENAIAGLIDANSSFDYSTKLNELELDDAIRSIKYTQYPYVKFSCYSLSNLIIRDADLMSVYEFDSCVLKKQMLGLYEEIRVSKPDLSLEEFAQGNDKFLANVSWLTNCATTKSNDLGFDKRRAELVDLLLT